MIILIKLFFIYRYINYYNVRIWQVLGMNIFYCMQQLIVLLIGMVGVGVSLYQLCCVSIRGGDCIKCLFQFWIKYGSWFVNNLLLIKYRLCLLSILKVYVYMCIRYNGSLKLCFIGEKFELMKYCIQGFFIQLYIIIYSFNIFYYLFRYRCVRN